MARWHGSGPFWSELQNLGSVLPWRQLQSLQHEVNRLFERLGDGPWQGAIGGSPALNVWEDGDEVTVEAELPGVTQDDLEILVASDNQLTLKGTRKTPSPEKGVWHRQERATGTFVRTLTLPFEVDR